MLVCVGIHHRDRTRVNANTTSASVFFRKNNVSTSQNQIHQKLFRRLLKEKNVSSKEPGINLTSM